MTNAAHFGTVDGLAFTTLSKITRIELVNLIMQNIFSALDFECVHLPGRVEVFLYKIEQVVDGVFMVMLYSFTMLALKKEAVIFSKVFESSVKAFKIKTEKKLEIPKTFIIFIIKKA